MRPFVLAAFAALAWPLAAHAQMAPPSQMKATAAPACAAMDEGLPPELAAWPSKVALTGAKGVSDLDKAVLNPGQAYLATLAATPDVTYVVKPEKPGDAASKGGIFAIDIPTAGSYIIALGSAAWIDVLKGDGVQTSAGHSHGPACSTVRKMVTFDLQPGRHVVQISSAADATVPILVAPKP
jgi:hypothetical protein